MLDLIPKKTIDEYLEIAGVNSLGVLKVIFDARQGIPVIDLDKLHDSISDIVTDEELGGAVSAAVKAGVFNEDKFLNDSVLTSKLMQYVALFTGVDIPGEHRIIEDSVNIAIQETHDALSAMFDANWDKMLSTKSQGAVVVADDVFDRLWKMYPSRNGRKIGKSDAKKFFKSNFKSQKKIDLLERAISNYIDGRGDVSARDMVRFMRNDFYLDWVEDAENDGVSYEDAVFDCRKNNLFPVSDYYEFGLDELWHKIV